MLHLIEEAGADPMKPTRTKNAPVAVPQDISAAGASALEKGRIIVIPKRTWDTMGDLHEPDLCSRVQKRLENIFSEQFPPMSSEEVLKRREYFKTLDALEYIVEKVKDLPREDNVVGVTVIIPAMPQKAEEQIFPNPHSMDKEPQGLAEFQQLAFDYHMSKGNHPTLCMVPSATFDRIVREAKDKFPAPYDADPNDQRTMIGGCEIIRDYHMETGMVFTHNTSKS